MSVVIEEGTNKGLTITGTMGLNDNSNPDYTIDEVPYTIVFDQQFKEAKEHLSLPDKTVTFLDGPTPVVKPQKTVVVKPKKAAPRTKQKAAPRTKQKAAANAPKAAANKPKVATRKSNRGRRNKR